MQKAIKKYIKELDGVITQDTYDIKLVAAITTRLEQISKKSELKHFIQTLTIFRDMSTYTASDFKFYDRVISRLTKIHKKGK